MSIIAGMARHLIKAYFAGCFGCLGALSMGVAIIVGAAVVVGPSLSATLPSMAPTIGQMLPQLAGVPGGPQQQSTQIRGLPTLTVQRSPSSTSETMLRIKVVGPDGAPITHLEVDLWTAPPSGGPPNAGIELTNSEGIAQFSVKPGEYAVGFNLNSFPPDLAFPRQMWTLVANPGQVGEATLRLEPRR